MNDKVKMDADGFLKVESRAEYRALLRRWASQTGSRAVCEYDGPGIYRPNGWYDYDEGCRACCTLSRRS